MDARGLIAFYMISGGGVCFVSGLKRFRKVREILDTPRSEIRSAPQGLVEVEGHALPYRGNFKNRDGKSVVYHCIKIEKKVPKGESSEWKELHRDERGVNFIVSDGTGIALVNATKADFLIKSSSRDWASLPEAEKFALFSKYDSVVDGLYTGKRRFYHNRASFRVVESYILESAPVYVRGSFKTSSADSVYRISPIHLRFLEKLIKLKREPTGRAKAFDLNRDGTVDEKEFSKGAEKLLSQARHAVVAEDRTESVSIQGTITNESPHGLTISDSHQSHLTLKLSSWNGVRIIGGALLIAVGLGLLVQSLFRR